MQTNCILYAFSSIFPLDCNQSVYAKNLEKQMNQLLIPALKTLVLSVLCCSFYSAVPFHFIAFSPQMQNAPLLVITICTLKDVWHQRPRWYLIHLKRLVYKMIVGSIVLYIFAAIWHKIHFLLHASRPQLCKKITNFQLYKIFFIK